MGSRANSMQATALIMMWHPGTAIGTLAPRSTNSSPDIEPTRMTFSVGTTPSIRRGSLMDLVTSRHTPRAEYALDVHGLPSDFPRSSLRRQMTRFSLSGRPRASITSCRYPLGSVFRMDSRHRLGETHSPPTLGPQHPCRAEACYAGRIQWIEWSALDAWPSWAIGASG